MFFFFSSRRRHTRLQGDWSSDVCSSDLGDGLARDLGGAGHAILGLGAVAEPVVHAEDSVALGEIEHAGSPGADHPENSWPMMRGSGLGSPVRVMEVGDHWSSVGVTAAACTRTSTSPSRASGTGTSS